MIAGKISGIYPDNCTNFEKPIITFDIDWAHDEIIHDLIDLVSQTKVPTTWFFTHDTKTLDRLRENDSFELGIHPNFNNLLVGDFYNGRTATEVVERLMGFIPEATVARSHSITQSSRITQIFRSVGITHESNDYIPITANIEIRPWRLESGVVRVPYFWSDELACSSYPDIMISKALDSRGLKIFDFHPIHVFLNTESLDRYERTRPLHHKPKELIKHRYDGYGSRNRLLELLEFAKFS